MTSQLKKIIEHAYLFVFGWLVLEACCKDGGFKRDFQKVRIVCLSSRFYITVFSR